MSNFVQIGHGMDVLPTLLALDRQPELWNIDPERKSGPHEAIDDIWIRFRKKSELGSNATYREPHFAEWYPAYYKLPQLRPLIFGLMARVEATHLGAVLITRIPPGQQVKPHVDAGWNAEYHNCKVYVPLQSNDQCVNICEKDAVVMRAGEIWTFNNLKDHSVLNNGKTDRMTLIISMRCDD